MRNLGIVGLIFVLIGCNESTGTDIPLLPDVCDCINDVAEYTSACDHHFPEGFSDIQRKECSGDESDSDTETDSVVVNPEQREAYENSTSLDIKHIEEEKENPISPDCLSFLEEYAAEIKVMTKLVDKMNAEPDNIEIKISFSSVSDEVNSYASKPQMFQCSQNEAFKKQVEILNGKRDKLLSY